MNRRDLMTGAAGAAGLAVLARTGGAAAQGSGPAAAQLNAVFDRIMDQALTRSPETTTGLGLDNGARAAWEGDKRRTTEQLAALRGVNRAGLGPQDQVNYDSVVYVTELADQGNRQFPFIGGPYVVSQLTGAYQG